MDYVNSSRSSFAAVVAGLLAGLLAWPTAGEAQLFTNTTQTLSNTTHALTSSTTTLTQAVSGQAAAVRANVLGTTTALADTGTLGGATDAREASALAGNLPSLLTGEVLHATTIGWPDQVASEASLANLALGVAGNTIGADFVMARARAIAGAAATGASSLVNLAVNGAPISVGTDPNQTIYIPGGRIVINEQIASTGGIVTNALHVVVDGVADVVVGSATASIR
jgi:hypothetical protein